MMTHAKSPAHYAFVLNRFPRKVTVGDAKSWLAQNDKKGKKLIIDNVIYHRLHNRYILPLLKVRKRYKSGFLMMAVLLPAN